MKILNMTETLESRYSQHAICHSFTEHVRQDNTENHIRKCEASPSTSIISFKQKRFFPLTTQNYQQVHDLYELLINYLPCFMYVMILFITER